MSGLKTLLWMGFPLFLMLGCAQPIPEFSNADIRIPEPALKSDSRASIIITPAYKVGDQIVFTESIRMKRHVGGFLGAFYKVVSRDTKMLRTIEVLEVKGGVPTRLRVLTRDAVSNVTYPAVEVWYGEKQECLPKPGTSGEKGMAIELAKLVLRGISENKTIFPETVKPLEIGERWVRRLGGSTLTSELVAVGKRNGKTYAKIHSTYKSDAGMDYEKNLMISHIDVDHGALVYQSRIFESRGLHGSARTDTFIEMKLSSK